MGGNTPSSLATVQTAGCGYRLKGRLMMRNLIHAGPMMRLMLRYTQALITKFPRLQSAIAIIR